MFEHLGWRGGLSGISRNSKAGVTLLKHALFVELTGKSGCLKSR